MNTEKQKQEMSFLEHLEVFRWHLVRSVFAVLFFAVIAFIFKGFVFDGILLAPKNPDFPTYKMLCFLSQKNDLICSKIFLKLILSNPINNKYEIENRQKSLFKLLQYV